MIGVYDDTKPFCQVVRGSERLSKAVELPLEGGPGLLCLRECPGEDCHRARASSGDRALGEAAAPAVVRSVDVELQRPVRLLRPRRGLVVEHVQGGVLGKRLLQRLEGLLRGLVFLVLGEACVLLGVRPQEPVMFLELRDELLDEVCEGSERDDVVERRGRWPALKRSDLSGVGLPQAVADEEAEHLDPQLAELALRGLELEPPLAGLQQEAAAVLDVALDDLLVGVALVGLGGDEDVVHEDRDELLSVLVPQTSEGIVHEPLEDGGPLLRPEVEHLRP